MLPLLWAALLVAPGCAPVPAAPGGAPVPPASGKPAPASPGGHEPRREGTRAGAVRDSTPSAEALRALATIPDPLPPSQQIPALHASGTVTVRAPEAAYDTLRAERAPVDDSAAVPVPSPTQPLGTTLAAALTMPDTLAAAPPASVPAKAVASPTTTPAMTPATTPAAPPASTAPASPPAAEPAKSAEPPAAKPVAGECWRLQVAAPEEKPKAESRRDAAESLLLVSMVIEFEKGLYKVRTRDCLTNTAAEALKKRAVDSGFDGAFVLNAAPAAAPAKPKPHPAAPHATHPKPPLAKKKPKR